MKHDLSFTITTAPSGAARLSMAGHWGNMPFASAEAAEAHARRVGGTGAEIRRERGGEARQIGDILSPIIAGIAGGDGDG